MLEEQMLDEPVTEQVTPEDFLETPEGHHCEFIDGKLVERNMGMESCEVAANVVELIRHHARGHQLGKAFTSDLGYQIFVDDPRKVRLPDVSFIAKARLPEGRRPRGHCRIPPDLAVEVVSPNDKAEELEVKRLDFFRAGTRQWWLIFPETRTVYVFHKVDSCVLFTEDQELTDDEILPGFRCLVRAFFED